MTISNKTTSGFSSASFCIASSADVASRTRYILLKTSCSDCLTPASSSTTSNKGWLISRFFSNSSNQKLHFQKVFFAVRIIENHVAAVALYQLFCEQDT